MRLPRALAAAAAMIAVFTFAAAAVASHNRIARVSTGPTGGNGPGDSCGGGGCAAFSDDGSRVFFTTHDRLVNEDADAHPDVYMRAGSTTTPISIGPSGG